MAKTPAFDLVEAAQEELAAFLATGGINERKLSKKLDFSGLDIDDFSRIKQVHFVLSKPAVEFVQELPRRIRKVKKESHRSSEISRGEIRGKIDWGATTKLRHSQSYGDTSLFVCEAPYFEYDIPENLVLKKLLSIIYRTVERDLKEVEYEWRTDRWDDELVTDIERTFERNVHVNRIRDPEDIRLRERDLDAARKSRNELYYESYKLLRQYRKLMANEFDKEEIGELLQQTLVEPKEVSTLFELFCVFKLVRALSEEYPGLRIQPMRKTSDAIARLESQDRVVNVYHDAGGDLEWYESIDDVKRPLPDYLQRYERVLDEYEEASQETLGKNVKRSLFSGRPDVVVEVYEKTSADDETLQRVILGEVKYTDKESTFSEGLKQLLKYLQYAKSDEEYLKETLSKLEGFLMVDSVAFDQPERDDLSVFDTDLLRETEELLS
ncbi:hypothetical protein EXE49_09250 [Halorubrum sp. ASP121]|uniref:hypothetical protein n=1 Tax=Halorubrum sp. ASP121 TaxID=1855858 RepID=UPI0010F4F377|nr:hypothetical protein [Halorubrum sp. ASP121]TKX49968.1 hypothetical protein EXE49_09250 [Halorubrum sp. ASP121]